MMKRLLIVTLLVALPAVSGLSGIDFGATIDNSTSYVQSSSTPFQQSDTLTAWLNARLGSRLTFNSQLHGSLATVAPKAAADLDLLTLTGVFPEVPNGPSVFGFTLGRFGLSDATAVIYSQVLDGFRLRFIYPGASVTTAVGYTGLILSPDSSIVMTKADLTAQSAALSDPNILSHFGSPRVVGLISLVLPSLFFRQDLTLQAVAQEDMRPYLDPGAIIAPGTTTVSATAGGRLNSQYLTALLSGPVMPSLFYNASFTLETGKTLSYVTDANGLSSYQYSPILAYYASGGLRYYLPRLLSSVISLGAQVASGDEYYTTAVEGNTVTQGTTPDRAQAFIPITQGSLAVVFSPGLTNIAVGSLSYSLKPLSWMKSRMLRSLQLQATGIPFVRLTRGPVDVSGVKTASDQLYLGSEIDLTANLRPFSDLGVSLQTGLFVPNPAAFVSTPGTVQLGGKIEVSLSL